MIGLRKKKILKPESTAPDTGATTENPNWNVEEGEITATEKQ